MPGQAKRSARLRRHPPAWGSVIIHVASLQPKKRAKGKRPHEGPGGEAGGACECDGESASGASAAAHTGPALWLRRELRGAEAHFSTLRTPGERWETEVAGVGEPGGGCRHQVVGFDRDVCGGEVPGSVADVEAA